MYILRCRPFTSAELNTVSVSLVAGLYITTYGLGIYALNLLIGFLSPASDPDTDGPTLPTSRDDEFRPFVRRRVPTRVSSAAYYTRLSRQPCLYLYEKSLV